LERDYLRQLIVQGGLAKLFWAGLQLAVLHLLVPAATTAWSDSEMASDALAFTEESLAELAQSQTSAIDLWQGAQAFWYSL